MAEAGNITDSETLYCTIHTNTATTLRCNKCERPMCTRCAVKTPVGYRCKECVRGQQQIYFNAQALDPLIQGGVSFVLSVVAATAIMLIGGGLGIWLLWIITIPASSAAGVLIADLSHRAVGKRRSRYSWLVVGAGIVAGALVVALVPTALSLLAYSQAVAPAPDVAYDPESGYYPQTGPGLWMLGGLGFTSIGWWVYTVAATAAGISTLRVGRGRFRFR